MKKQNFKYYAAGVVSLITFIVYLPSLQNAFVLWDDEYNVTENPYIRSLDLSFFKWAFLDLSAPGADYWRPLSYLSHALDYAVWGLDPMGHHLTNNILHTVNTFLVVLLVVKLMEAGWNGPTTRGGVETRSYNIIAAATTGLLFGIHPLHVESVAWVSERKDLLCALFFLLSIMMYLSYMSHKTYRTYLLSLAFFALALLSKPMAVSLPLVLLILDWYPFARITTFRTFRTAFTEKLPFIALSLVSTVLTALVQKAIGAMDLMKFIPLSTRLLLAAKSLIVYIWKMILPVHLIPYYPYPKDVSLFSGEYLLAIILAAVITTVCIIMVKKQRALLSVWSYYFVTLLPVLGLVQVGGQSMADRYTYLPSLGPFLLIGTITAQVSSVKRGGRSVMFFSIIAAFFVLLSLSALTYKQVQIWKNSFTLWTYVIEKEPARISVAYNNRGLAFFTMGETDRAIEDYHKAIAMDPQYAEVHSNLGAALFKKGLVNEAIREFQTAIRFSPDLLNAHRNLAPALYQSGRFREALEEYLIVTRLRPDDAGAHADLGAVYGAMGSYNEAIEHFQIAIRLRPDFADAYYNLGIAYQTKGLMDQAIKHLEAASRLNPADAMIRNDLVRAYSLRNSAVKPAR